MTSTLFTGLREYSRKQKGGGVIKKIMKLAKLVVIGIAVVTKICIILKFIHTMLKFKYLAVAAGYLALSGVKLWLYAKQQKQPPKVVFYTHSTHEHNVDHDSEDWIGETWKRKIGIADHDHDVQELPFARHKPSYAFLRQPEEIY